MNTTIKYTFATGETQEVEVTQEFAQKIRKIKTIQKTEHRQFQRKTLSLDLAVAETDSQFVDENSCIEENFFGEMQAKINDDNLQIALSKLSQKQIALVQKIFFERKTKTGAASELGVSVSAITQQEKTILKKLKKFFKKP